MGATALFLPSMFAAALLGPGWLLPLGGASVLAFLLLTSCAFVFYRQEAARRDVVRSMFSTMVSPQVLRMMEDHPETFELRGEKREATMFFSDVAGFTAISEKLGPAELAGLLNRYLTPMTEIILAHDGYLDKYSGDGIMAVWGVPYPDAAHAAKACRAAWGQQERLRGLARDIEAETGVMLAVRMGLNSGTVSAGNMGSTRKFQYTVMGDAVNLAARLEPANKDYGTGIILGEATRRMLGPEFLVRKLDRLVVKGKTGAVDIFELLGVDGGPLPAWVAVYEEGLEKMRMRDWNGAGQAFARCRDLRPGGDAASETMLARVGRLRTDPPGPDWNGENIRTGKD